MENRRRGKGLSMSSTTTSRTSLVMPSISRRTWPAIASQSSHVAPVIGTPASISSSVAAGFQRGREVDDPSVAQGLHHLIGDRLPPSPSLDDEFHREKLGRRRAGLLPQC